ncbi:MAG: amidohydrolase family protein [Rhodospirillales bacterium]|nr:amidohydrolase family protein [Rhodospirillales bacterium]MBT4005762.1 amidohydrolase family protein [Rhodospirillales bacterium]MBT5076172.1 amidohydrolase family protein [Rhodospirillales bacterium]MBT5114047.1 amidohydrolase family protein [Rhodospirillales bacterium]MBT5672575.1 amidohydrolase family protein [Rhodospirillales bacterium]
MPTIDADAHVLETPDTWSYMSEDEQEFRPQIFTRDPNDGAPYRENQRRDYWKIGDHFQTKTNVGSDVPVEARDMVDIKRRLDHMNEIGVDIQVLYPTLFLRPVTTEHDVELMLVKSYNRWLADIWKQSDNRLRWVAMPPLLSMIDPGKVRAELEFCKANGAVGIFMRGFECEMLAGHRYFFPLYAMAEELGLAITFHAGNNSFANHNSFSRDAGMLIFKFPVMAAFLDVLVRGIPERFPNLHWAFIEASAQWVPYMLGEAKMRIERQGRRMSDHILDDNHFFITTQKSDDLNWLLEELGSDNLVVGTDYGHKDSATEVQALKRMSEDGNIPPAILKSILETNPSRLYALQ